MEDDIYRGMHIPKGSLVFGNIWTILRDESMYPNADAFLPERFLEPAESPEMERKRNPLNYVFGFGRRCESQKFPRSTENLPPTLTPDNALA